MASGMNSLYYECHITLKPEDRIKSLDIAFNYNFHDSIIYKDEVLGDEKYAYLSKRGKRYSLLAVDMDSVCDELIAIGVNPIRRKIESAIEDARYVEGKWKEL